MWLVLLAALAANAVQPAWQPVTTGVERLSLPVGQAELLRFDLEHFAVDVTVPGAARPVTARVARTEARAALAVNGGFFDTDGRPLGLRIGAGGTVKGLRPRVDWGVLEVRDRRARIVHSRAFAPDPAITAAVQVGPRVLVAGTVPGLKPQRSRRTAVAVDAHGRHLVILVTRTAVGADELGEALRALGLHDALLLDGGPSTQLSAALGPLTLEVPGGYPVPDLVLVRPRAK